MRARGAETSSGCTRMYMHARPSRQATAAAASWSVKRRPRLLYAPPGRELSALFVYRTLDRARARVSLNIFPSLFMRRIYHRAARILPADYFALSLLRRRGGRGAGLKCVWVYYLIRARRGFLVLARALLFSGPLRALENWLFTRETVYERSAFSAAGSEDCFLCATGAGAYTAYTR